MTRKDYILIAKAIRETREASFRTKSGLPETRAFLDAYREGVKHAAFRISDALKAENTGFKPETFLDACDLYSEPRETGAAKS